MSDRETARPPHVPVLYDEVLEWLTLTPTVYYIDSTVGAGGHAWGILEGSSPDGQLLGLDADPEALEIAREIGDRRNEVAWLTNLGRAYRDLGQVERAIESHEQALAIAREIGDRQREGRDLGSLGVVYHMLGQVERAIEYAEQALAISREIGHRQGEAGQGLQEMVDLVLIDFIKDTSTVVSGGTVYRLVYRSQPVPWRTFSGRAAHQSVPPSVAE